MLPKPTLQPIEMQTNPKLCSATVATIVQNLTKIRDYPIVAATAVAPPKPTKPPKKST